MIRKPAILAFGWNPWSDYWMPRQQYLSRFGARGWPVAYTAGSPFAYELRPKRRDPQHRLFGQFETMSNVHVFRPGLLPPRWPRWPAYDGMVLRREVRRLKSIGNAAALEKIAFITHPRFADYLDHLDKMRVVYFSEDAFSLMPGATETERRKEAKLVDRADLIVTCAQSMADCLPGHWQDRTKILRNGVDFSAYENGRSAPCPADLDAVPEPRVGYTGSLNLKVDFPLIAAISRARPEVHWVLIGPVNLPETPNTEDQAAILAGYRETCARPNVHYLGSKPFYELPRYMANMTVNTMCYRTDGDGWWKAIDPLKTNEYMASGKPIISADLVNVRPYADCLQITHSTDGWLAALDHALTTDPSQVSARGIERARQNDWEIMTDSFEELLLELAGR
ncbi:MAG: hypothetical protein OXT06_11700 [Rhodospirillaceae bacterium]|nr:hypothetical protein [Rhodospirillaceae bacterium]MDD9918734.1 hypothetical protein [Rhodospirillaceae bacterium]